LGNGYEIEVEVEYDATSPEPMTRNYPGWPGSLEIVEIVAVGEPLLGIASGQVIEPAYMRCSLDRVEEEIWEEVEEERRSLRECCRGRRF